MFLIKAHDGYLNSYFFNIQKTFDQIVDSHEGFKLKWHGKTGRKFFRRSVAWSQSKIDLDVFIHGINIYANVMNTIVVAFVQNIMAIWTNTADWAAVARASLLRSVFILL